MAKILMLLYALTVMQTGQSTCEELKVNRSGPEVRDTDTSICQDHLESRLHACLVPFETRWAAQSADHNSTVIRQLCRQYREALMCLTVELQGCTATDHNLNMIATRIGNLRTTMEILCSGSARRPAQPAKPATYRHTTQVSTTQIYLSNQNGQDDLVKKVKGPNQSKDSLKEKGNTVTSIDHSYSKLSTTDEGMSVHEHTTMPISEFETIRNNTNEKRNVNSYKSAPLSLHYKRDCEQYGVCNHNVLNSNHDVELFKSTSSVASHGNLSQRDATFALVALLICYCNMYRFSLPN